MDETGESSQESSRGATTALHLEDSSTVHVHRSLSADRESLQQQQQQLDDLIDEQFQSIQDELQRQIDEEINNAMQKQIDDALQKQIDEAFQKELDDAVEKQKESLNDEFNRAMDLYNRELSLATPPSLTNLTSVHDDESVEKLLQEYLNSQK
jgi:dsDNA-specific endonuclease/ATPase MutS2